MAKVNYSDVVAYSALIGVGLALLLRGFIPLLRAENGSVEIYEHNRALLIAETIGLVGITGFGVVKLVQVARDKSGTQGGKS